MPEHSGVFLLQGGDSLLPMAHFATESDFQRLLARFASRIPRAGPRRVSQ